MTLALTYRAQDDHFVLTDDDRILSAAPAHDIAAGIFCDPKYAAIGIRRFLTFKDWQMHVAGRVLFPGSVETAREQLPRTSV
jgi:hypothetical protein